MTSRSLGSGDVRTRRGKITNGSYGKSRPHRAKKSAPVTKAGGKAKGR